MPEESIASYTNNIVTFALVIIAASAVFLALFFIWRGLVFRSKRRYSPGPIIKEGAVFQGKGRLSDFKKTPYLVQGIFVLASGFIFIVLFLLLVFTVFNYTADLGTGGGLYIIIGIVFYLVMILIFLVTSKILD